MDLSEYRQRKSPEALIMDIESNCHYLKCIDHSNYAIISLTSPNCKDLILELLLELDITYTILGYILTIEYDSLIILKEYIKTERYKLIKEI